MKRKEFLDKMMMGSLGIIGAGSIKGKFLKNLYAMNEGGNRSRMLFDFNWRFHLGDVRNGQKPGFSDDSWRKLNLPHDWSIEGQFSKNNPAGADGGALPGGIGWYRKSFTMPESKKGKLIFIEFYGVYENSDVWINGHHLGKRPYGYSTFRYDMTPYLHYGHRKNEIAVRVDNSHQPNSRWYSGSGIYRHVWLIETNKIHVDQWGTYITTPLINKSTANVAIQTKIKNEEHGNRSVTLRTVIYDKNDHKVAEDTQQKTVHEKAVLEVPQYLKVKNPILWSTDYPYMYKVVSFVEENGQQLDRYETPIGMRYFRFDADSGFYLNGKPLKILGMCDHHNDLGPLGSAQNKRAIKRRMELLKDMGVNAIRTSHNPPTPDLLDLADQMGFIVMDEAFDCWDRGKVKYDYHIYWDKWHKRDLEDMLKRDRNHPSIFLWSIGNEIPEQWHPKGREIALELAGIVKSLDTTRPITSACNHPSPDNYLIKSGALDVIGINYHHEEYPYIRKLFPGKKFIATETTSAIQSRGVYDMPADKIRIWPTRDHKGMSPDYTCSSYDNCRVPWGATHEENWKMVSQYDYISGMFGWTGFDYLGEPTPYGWPARSSYFGILDLCGIPKDAFYFYQSQWKEKPVLHVFPHWNWKEGQEVDIWAYTNCDDVELFLNGKSVGTKYFDRDNMHLSWKVKFEPGTLKAVGRRNGQVILTKEIHTAGDPAKITLEPDREKIMADGQDLTFITVNVTDKDGNLIPHADNMIHFNVSGEGAIASIGNGHEISHESFQAPQHKVFNGKCMAIIQSGGKAGNIQVKASSSGLESSSVTIQTT
ncbi:MAG TPA: beta-galactosidase GalB [Balneolales bacterium]|nr:beta-galactosidase GalB [Balneolales bacterium]